MPMMEALKNVMLGETVDIKVINLLNSMVKSMGFTDTLFVGAAGDNSDGSSWTKAYTSLKTAIDWIEANQSTGECHLIVLGDGAWEMDTTLAPTYTTNIAIYGIDSREQAVISNSHATATHVLKFTGWCSINNVTIDCGTGNIGIEIDSTSANGSRLRKLYIDCTGLTAAADAILLDNSVKGVKCVDIHIKGEATNTTALHLDDANACWFETVLIGTALVGIHLDHNDDDNNEFIGIDLKTATTGIQIDNAGSTSNHFSGIKFSGCTTRINDNGTSTIFDNLSFAETLVASIFPADLTGQVVAADAVANTWTVAAVQIRSAVAASKPFYITGMVYEPAALEKWGVRFYDDGGTTPFWDGIVEAAANRSNRILFGEKYFISQGTAIHGTVKSESGGNNMDLWIKIEEI